MTDTTLVTAASTSPESTAPVPAAETQVEAANSSPAQGGETLLTGDTPVAEGEPTKAVEEVAKATAPESYEDFTYAEGVILDPEVSADLKTLAKELDLPQEQAQKVADLGAKLATKWQADLQDSITKASELWATDTKADKEIGGEKLTESLGAAKLALDKFGTPELRTLLDTSNLGNHPEVIRLLVRAGKAISDDTFVGGGTARAEPKTAAQALYPTNNKS